MLKIILNNWATIHKLLAHSFTALIILLIPFFGPLVATACYSGYVVKLAFIDFNNTIHKVTSEESLYSETKAALGLITALGLLTICSFGSTMYIFDLMFNVEAIVVAVVMSLIILAVAIICCMCGIMNQAAIVKASLDKDHIDSDTQ